MFKNYLTIAFRNLLKFKFYTAINVFGLAIGITCCLLLTLFIQHEIRYDRFHDNADRIYRVIKSKTVDTGKEMFHTGTSGQLGPMLKEQIPEIEDIVRIWKSDSKLVRSGEKMFYQAFCAADESILTVFNFPLLVGDPQTVFQDPHTVVITEAMAEKFFANQNPIGKVISVEHHWFKGDYTVTGVLKNIPQNSTLRFDFLSASTPKFPASRTVYAKKAWERWGTFGGQIQTYFLLAQDAPYISVQNKINTNTLLQTARSHFTAQTAYHLQPLNRQHLYSQTDYQLPSKGNIQDIYLLAAIAFFVLLIACLNFVNLATARASNRAKEVGLRKVVGAVKHQLVFQFLGESILLTLLAFGLAIGLTELTLPAFNAFTEKTLTLHHLPTTLLYMGCSALILGIITGIYPAFFLSKHNPISALKQQSENSTRHATFRQGFVILQFAISVAFIIGSLVLNKQMAFVKNKDLGFDQQAIVTMPIFWRAGRTLREKSQTIKTEFLNHPNIISTSTSGTLAGFHWGKTPYTQQVHPEGSSKADTPMHIMPIDENFLETFGIPLIDGRNLSSKIANESTTEYLINETAAKQLGWDNPIGKTFKLHWMKGSVIGVVKDFHFTSLHEKIGPIAMHHAKSSRTTQFMYLSVKVHTQNMSETLAFLETKWKTFLPDRPFEYSFLEDNINTISYKNEERMRQLTHLAAFITMLIACTGLMGLAAFSVAQRTKEIGIRKILGASVSNIVRLLSLDFMKLIALANVIAFPTAYYLLNAWLDNFAYRIALDASAFFWGGCFIFLVAFITVCLYTVKAATSNPIHTLRQD